MKRFHDEKQVASLPESRFKQAMLERIVATHATCEGLECDILVECGDFVLLEVGDDPKVVALYEGGEAIDLTDFEARCYEYVELSEDATVFELYLVTSNAGGPSFFVPNEAWIGGEFLGELKRLTDAEPCDDETPDQIEEGESAC